MVDGGGQVLDLKVSLKVVAWESLPLTSSPLAPSPRPLAAGV